LRAIGYRKVLDGRRSESDYHHGRFATPSLTADYMAGKVLPYLTDGGVCLDPAAGGGAFLAALRRAGLPRDRIHALEVDPHAAQGLGALAGHVSVGDFLLGEAPRRYRAIIGNPPYQSHECAAIRANRAELERRYGRGSLGNLYCLFTLAALDALEEGGVLCFLLLDSFLTTNSYQPFRRLLLERTSIREVLLAPRSLFRPQGADVRTAILTLEKRGHFFGSAGLLISTVDRVACEEEYGRAPSEWVPQAEWQADPCRRFLVAVPAALARPVTHAQRTIGSVFEGGTGISTGNDRRFLRPASEVPQEDGWVPFYKNPSRPYHSPPGSYIHQDWQAGVMESKTYLARNRGCFFQEGIACSSMGVPFRACHMPAGCLFGVNTCLFHEDRTTLLAGLAYLNSSLAEYWVRAVLNRTNMVTARYVKALPWPSWSTKTLSQLAREAASARDGLKAGTDVDLVAVRRRVDDLVFPAFGLGGHTAVALRGRVESFCAHILDRL
jgi:hypothetical protein